MDDLHAIRVEPAGQEDAPALCVIFNDARREAGCFPAMDFPVSDFLKAVEGEQVLVARMGGEIAGFASVWQPETFLHHLYVSPRFQRLGVGGRLLGACIDRFGLPMSLKCVVANVAACRFYESRGWRPMEYADGTEGRYILYTRAGAG